MRKNRRPATAEEKERAAERRARVRELARQISAMSLDERLAMAKAAGVRTIEGHELSIRNQCLCISQRDGVSVVGGLRQWRAAGRRVRKGEHGLGIWVPVAGEGANTESEGEGESRTFFVVGYVFDVSQTDQASEPNEELSEMASTAATRGSQYAEVAA
jgi:hypothetical protein